MRPSAAAIAASAVLEKEERDIEIAAEVSRGSPFGILGIHPKSSSEEVLGSTIRHLRSTKDNKDLTLTLSILDSEVVPETCDALPP